MKKLFILLFFAMLSLVGFSQDFIVDGLGYSVIHKGGSYFDDSEEQADWYDGNCVALTWIENAKDRHDLTIPNQVAHGGKIYAVKAIAPSTFKDAKLGTVSIKNGVIRVFFDNAQIKKLIFEDGTEIVGTSYNAYTEDEYGLTLSGANIEDIYFGRAVSNRITSDYCAFVKAGVKSFTFGKNMDRVPIAFLLGNPISKIEIPKNVLAIFYMAFQDCKNLETVQIDSLQGAIFEEVFEGCEKLKRVDIKGCSDIGDKAFKGCASLEEINIPSGVVVIGDSAFADCSSLRVVSLPNSLLHLGAPYSFWSLFGANYNGSIIGNSFAGCSSLRKIELRASTPIANMLSNFDESVYEQAKLCVPVGCKAVYAEADGWNAFSHIEEEEMDKDDLCSLLILGCGYDSWTGCLHVDAAIDGVKLRDSAGEVYYRKVGDVVNLKLFSGYCEERDNKPTDVDSIFVNGENVTNLLQDNALTLKVDRSMEITVTHKLHGEDTGIGQVEMNDVNLSVEGKKVTIQKAHIGDAVYVFDLLGRRILSDRITEVRKSILLPSNGIYIVQVGGVKKKVIVR